jgi:mono/diheme cytochrome c family protein
MHSHASLAVLAAIAVSAPALSIAQTVTFNKDIAPIVYKNCASCHRPGEAAPFSLLSFQDVSKRGRIIASVTQSRFMPPWKAEETSYPFRDERHLGDSEIALIQQWVKQGMPEGKPSDAPTPPKFASGWMLGEPDLIV